jgi:hypothetical protein
MPEYAATAVRPDVATEEGTPEKLLREERGVANPPLDSPRSPPLRPALSVARPPPVRPTEAAVSSQSAAPLRAWSRKGTTRSSRACVRGLHGHVGPCTWPTRGPLFPFLPFYFPSLHLDFHLDRPKFKSAQPRRFPPVFKIVFC